MVIFGPSVLAVWFLFIGLSSFGLMDPTPFGLVHSDHLNSVMRIHSFLGPSNQPLFWAKCFLLNYTFGQFIYSHCFGFPIFVKTACHSFILGKISQNTTLYKAELVHKTKSRGPNKDKTGGPNVRQKDRINRKPKDRI